MGKKRRSARVSLSGIVGVGDKRNTHNLEGQIDLIVPLVLLLSLLLVFRTGTTGLINLGDSLFPFFPQETFQRFLYLWDSHVVLGRDNSASVPQLLWYGTAALLDRLEAPLWVSNRFWFVLPFFLLGLSMHFLSGVVFGKGKKASRFIASLFFMFNPFTLNLVSGSNILTLSFAAGVFVFGLFVRGLERSKFAIKDVLLLGLVSVFATASAVIWAMIILLCTAYLIFFVIVNRANRKKLIHVPKYLLLAVCYTLLANSWWLLPFAYQFLNPGYFSTLFAAGTDVSTLNFMAEHTSLFDVSRLFYGIAPTSYFPISNYYHYLSAPTVMSVLTVVIFSVALFKKKSKFEIFFLLLAVFSVILASGTRPPFGFIYQFLWDNVPYFHIFRTTNRFNLYTMISYAVLLGFLYQHGEEYLERKFGRLTNSHPKPFKFFVGGFLTVSTLLSAWPLLSGDVFGQLKPHPIPQDYYQLREFLKNQEGDFRIMSLPMISWLAAYSWSAPFDMQEILLDFSPKDTVVNMPGYLDDLKHRGPIESDALYADVYYFLEHNLNNWEVVGKLAENSESIQKITPDVIARHKDLAIKKIIENLQLMNVKYLVLHRDYVIIYHDFPSPDITVLEDNLRSLAGIKFIRSFGELDVYEVQDPRPRIYTMPFKADEGAAGPTVSYKRISPVEYQIAVEGVSAPYYLIFGENFNDGWRLSLSGNHQGSLRKGFGNVWQVDEVGDYQMTLTYQPQRLLEIGLLISFLSVVGGAVVVFTLLTRKR